jgi:hypothetical protein
MKLKEVVIYTYVNDIHPKHKQVFHFCFCLIKTKPPPVAAQPGLLPMTNQSWVPDMCANYGLWRSVRRSEKDEEEIVEDEDKKYVLGDILEELD